MRTTALAAAAALFFVTFSSQALADEPGHDPKASAVALDFGTGVLVGSLLGDLGFTGVQATIAVKLGQHIAANVGPADRSGSR
jgi:hypothetical protein